MQSREVILAKRKEYREENKEKLSLAYAEWYAKNKESVLKRKKLYREKNRDILNKNKNIWYAKNTKHLKEYRRSRRKINAIQERKRNHINQQYRLSNLLRNRLFCAFRDFSKNGKIKSSGKYGIDYKAIFNHIGSKPDTIRIWHIDHIKPLCLFDFNNEEQIKIAFAPENHQWLTAEENLKKGGKLLC